MGYNLTIGEAEVFWDEDLVRVEAATVRLDEAPAFGEPTDHQNIRWPSYSSWSNFCKAVGLMPLFFGNETGHHRGESIKHGDIWVQPLMPEHPGIAPITNAVQEIIHRADKAYRDKHPDHIAQFPTLRPGVEKKGIWNRSEDYVSDPKYDGNLCRLEWLRFWVDWSIENCEKPVFVNS